MPDLSAAELERAVHEQVSARLARAPGCHDMDHTLRVFRNACTLAAELPGIDHQIVRLAALLHDMARPEELASKGARRHEAEGAVMAAELLRSLGASPTLAGRVADCVRTHRYRGGERPATLEAAVVYDADKLDSVGAVGIGRAFHFAGREGARLHNRAAEALAAPEYSREDSAYREYLVKLRHITGAMMTAPGRREAEKRSLFMTEFFRRMNEESGLDEAIPEAFPLTK